MKRNIHCLTGFKMGAAEGEIGEVKEFYFDDETWAIRYLIVETGNWLTNRKVLISLQALLAPDWEKKAFPINLTKEQIKSSPNIDTDKPISHRQEIEMYRHYSWQPYEGIGYYVGGSAIMNLPLRIDKNIVKEDDTIDIHSDDDPHLRSTERVSGYHIHATDGDIGHVKDFIIDDQTWQITDLVIDTNNWIGGKKVLIGVQHIKEIQSENSKIILDITVDAVKGSKVLDDPEFIYPQNIFEL